MTQVTTAAQHHLLPLLDHLARLGRRAAENAMTPGDLRPRHLIALKLLSEQGQTSQQGLADALSLDPSNVVGLLNELEERELITRRRDPIDRRRHIVELSRAGQAELNLAYARLGCVEDELFNELTSEDRATLYHLLTRAAGVSTAPCDAASAAPCDGPGASPSVLPDPRRGLASPTIVS
jgi:DNA-binding MarR family transcriptional regulator